ncbi:MarR family winged helix-turn-helix transcriptional regulator [Ciceribacter azotifigens]|uniref:MarR family winged helix-turn-helix transcriptional regulator n=1 Tax=Ciceribacter azotifigens TaxID=2069303 RepID=UPI003A8A8B1F
MAGAPDLNESFTRSLAMVSRQWTRHVDLQFRELGLSQARWRVLFELSRHQDVTQIELAHSLGIEGATLVRLLDRLEAVGLVERHPCEDDRRAKRLRLTDGAKPLIDKMKKIAADSRAELLAEVSPEDLRTATRVLSQIEARLGLWRSEQNG